MVHKRPRGRAYILHLTAATAKTIKYDISDHFPIVLQLDDRKAAQNER